MQPELSVSRDIAASPAAVYAAITDISRMGEWSPENHANEWKDGVSQAVVGARWVGHNRNGEYEWTTESRVAELVENERFYFDCLAPRLDDFHFASWGYDIEATATGCRVTEHWQDLRPEESKGRSSQISGVTDRTAHNHAMMEATLAALAAAVEQQ